MLKFWCINLAIINRYRIISIECPVSDIKVFRFQPFSGEIPQFTPGQWVFLHLLDEKGNSVEKRPYSIASSPSAPYLEFAIDMIHGKLTSKLDLMTVGDKVGIEGPMGHLTYKDQTKAAFIAGGTGVAPMMSMLRHIAEKKIDGTFVLFYTTRTRERVLYKEELEKLHEKNSGIKVVITLTREKPTNWVGECGRINHEMINKHTNKASEHDWWMCGPMDLIKNMRVCLTGMGVDGKKLRMEGWG